MTSYNVTYRLIWGPSSTTNEVSGVESVGMSKDDINYLINSFAQASKRAKEGGFDGIQIHCAHGYMLSQFISPYYNKRIDEDKPLNTYEGYLIAKIIREDDIEDKWILSNKKVTKEEIIEKTFFIEQYFKSTVIMIDE